jgi:OFA family oxalate/formate antiporter-like MFS transporter
MPDAHATTSRTRPGLRRWAIAGAAVLVQLALGAVYAWSVFARPLETQMGWSKSEAAAPFVVTIGVIFVGSLVGGRVQDRIGPRPVVLAGGLLYSVGVALASLVERGDQLWLLVATYGVLGGIGLGLAYIVPIAMLAKWFPDKRGLITGIAVGGFGAGALVTAPLAQVLIGANEGDVAQSFLPLGLMYLAMTVVGGLFFRNPPADYTVPGEATGAASEQDGAHTYSLSAALRTPQWYLLTLILTLNVTAGIALISQASPALQEVTGIDAAVAAGLVGTLAIFNGAGRVLWAWLSDHIGRMRVFALMFLIDAVAFVVLPYAAAVWLFVALAATVYLVYGGGFGTMPATAADFFGTRHAGAIYGAMIVAWSLGGVIGPLVIAWLVEATGGFTVPFLLIAGMSLVALVLPFVTRPPAGRRAPAEERQPMRAGAV